MTWQAPYFDANGYTVYTPSDGTGSGGVNVNVTHIAYVSSSGNNATAVINNSALPWATIQGPTGALKFLTDTYGTGLPNWILIKKGGTFTDDTFQAIVGNQFELYGQSAAEPFLISSYDPAYTTTSASWGGTYNTPNPTGSALARPIVTPPVNITPFTTVGANLSNGWYFKGGDYVEMSGIHLYNRFGDPANGPITRPSCLGVAFLNQCHRFRMEDCQVNWFSDGMGFQAGATIYRCIISNNLDQGIAASMLSKATGTPLPCGFQQNLLYHNGYYAMWQNLNVSITQQSPAVVSYPNSFPTANGTAIIQFATGNASIAANTDYYIWNNNGSTFTLSTSSSSNVAVNNTTSPLSGITGTVNEIDGGPIGPNPSVHAVYFDGYIRPYVGLDPGGTNFDGNVVAYDQFAPQIRCGGTINDNAFLKMGYGFTYGTCGARQTSITNNVHMDPMLFTTGGSSSTERIANLGMGVNYQAGAFNLGSTLIDGNIIVHGPQTETSGIYIVDGQNSVTYSNNIVWDWPLSNVNDAIRVPPTGCMTSVGVITPGSGYTDRSTSITAVTRDADSQCLVLTISSMATFLTDLDIAAPFSAVWITGLAGFTGVNNQMWIAEQYSTTEIILDNSASAVGASGANSGTVYVPYGFTAITGGSGSGAHCSIASVGGQIKIVHLPCEDAHNSNNGGSGYHVGDSLSATLAGGSGFSFLVGAIGTITDGGGNVKDPNGSNPALHPEWPHPTRSAGTYYNSLYGGSGATTDDYLTALLGLQKGTADIRLFAPALNNYIRAGFGVNSDTTPPTLMAQICM